MVASEYSTVSTRLLVCNLAATAVVTIVRSWSGVNAVQKSWPWHPSTGTFDAQSSLNAQDMANLKAWGFNTVRLGVMWCADSQHSPLRPTQGAQAWRRTFSRAVQHHIPASHAPAGRRFAQRCRFPLLPVVNTVVTRLVQLAYIQLWTSIRTSSHRNGIGSRAARG